MSLKTLLTQKEDCQSFTLSGEACIPILEISRTIYGMWDIPEFELENYGLNYVYRVNNKGGGVAKYVKRNTKFYSNRYIVSCS